MADIERKKQPTMQRLRWVLLFALLAAFAILSALHPPPPLTAEQQQARDLAAQRVRDEQTARQERVTSLCRAWQTCQDYSSARQECAVAGDFNNCLRIKLGEDIARVSDCASDGNLLYPPSDMPNRLECIVHRFGG